jgi:hypothetical protein
VGSRSRLVVQEGEWLDWDAVDRSERFNGVAPQLFPLRWSRLDEKAHLVVWREV